MCVTLLMPSPGTRALQWQEREERRVKSKTEHVKSQEEAAAQRAQVRACIAASHEHAVPGLRAAATCPVLYLVTSSRRRSSRPSSASASCRRSCSESRTRAPPHWARRPLTTMCTAGALSSEASSPPPTSRTTCRSASGAGGLTTSSCVWFLRRTCIHFTLLV